MRKRESEWVFCSCLLYTSKYAKILAKSIVSPEGNSDHGQNAFFYDAAEGLLSSTVLLLAESVSYTHLDVYKRQDKNDDWLNIYANYDIAEDRPCDTLELTLCKGDGSEESWSYQLNAAEQDVLLRKMEEYCQQQTGMSLHDYAQQFREEPEQQQGPVMKL